MLKNKLKEIRHDRRMNEKEFAAFLGVNYSLYNRWEKQHGQPGREWLLKLCEILKCNISDIVDQEK